MRAPLPHSMRAHCTHVMSGLDQYPERSTLPAHVLPLPRHVPDARPVRATLTRVHAYPCACLPAHSRVTSRARPRPHLHKPRNLPTASPFLPTYSLPINPDIATHNAHEIRE